MGTRIVIRYLLIGLTVLTAFTATAQEATVSGPVQYPKVHCGDLAALQFWSVEIAQSVEQPAGPVKSSGKSTAQLAIEAPAHCLVTGVIDKRIGIGNRPYGIHFEMRLPDNWNGRFLFQGGGGLNGIVSPAIGSVKGPPALSRGFAVVTQDAGHQGTDASFGEDQKARIDMEYRSYEQVTIIAKRLLAAYYGKNADHSYFMGCSEGGREALLVSQRLPLEYDGVVAGDPGFLLGVDLNGEWSSRAFRKIAPLVDGKPDTDRAFTDQDLKLVAGLILKRCDALDGLEDGIIDNWPACQVKISELICKSAKTDKCISKAQADALEAYYQGGSDSKGRRIASGYPYDSGIGQPNWRQWKLRNNGMRNGVSPLQGLFLSPYDPNFDSDNFDFDKDPLRMVETGSLYRADAVSYSSFKAHGGKVLIYTGASDPVFSPKDLIAYYARLIAANGGTQEGQSFARLFVVPGMTHCRGGLALDDFDPLPALVAWVEKNAPPEKLITTGSPFPGRSRPICPYPQQSRYKGTGSIEDADNFECR